LRIAQKAVNGSFGENNIVKKAKQFSHGLQYSALSRRILRNPRKSKKYSSFCKVCSRMIFVSFNSNFESEERISMKNLLVSALSAVLLLSGVSAFAQTGESETSASAITTAEIVSPLVIAKTDDLNFGTLLSPTAAATLIVQPDGDLAGDTNLRVVSGQSAKPASFAIAGDIGAVVYITLPAADYNVSNGSETMTITNIVSDPSAQLTLGPGGSGEITVGATLEIDANQEAGTYTNASDLEVTISY
jgi:hypothetical protein